MEGVELEPEPPAVAFALLPVEAEEDDPPVPDEFADVEVLVVVDALDEPPDVVVGLGVGVGEAVGLGVGVGEAVGLGVGVGHGVGVGEAVGVGVGVCELVPCPLELDPVFVVVPVDEPDVAVGVGVGAGVGVGVGAGVGLGVGLGVLAVDVVVVVEVVDVVADPPLIDGFTLMIGSTMIEGELLIVATALARAPPPRW